MRPEKRINKDSLVGVVNALGVYGANMGMLMEIEASAKKVKDGMGTIKITGIVEEEEISNFNKKIRRKSTAYCSIENVLTVLDNVFELECKDYNIHVNFSGGIPMDGPSAGISIATAIYSAIMNIKISNKVAMTGEISLRGEVKPIGGVNAKISAAIKAGCNTVIIPRDNWVDSYKDIKGIRVLSVTNIKQVLDLALINIYDKIGSINIDNVDILSAKSMN